MSATCQECRGKRQLPYEVLKYIPAQARWLCARCRQTLRIS